MKKIPLFISLLSIIAADTANANIPQVKEVFQTKASKDCSAWDSQNLLAKSDKRLEFAKGITHCLQQMDRSSLSPTQSESEFREMHNRFYETYDTLRDTESRVKFTLLFISRVSEIHKVGVREIENKNHALIFSYVLKSGTKTLRLMEVTSDKPNDYLPTEQDYTKFGNLNDISKEYESLVAYVIHGKKSSQLKKLDIEITPLTSDDEAYVEWAEDQAESTCEYMDCSYEWRTNEYGEDYIHFSSENSDGYWDLWEGYHYTPQDRYL